MTASASSRLAGSPPFGEEALRLEARALAPVRPGDVRVGFAWPALDPAAAKALQGSRAARVRGGEDDWASLACEESALRGLAGDFPGLRPLLLAHEQATRPLHPRVMGIVNVTPDSFSDGGRFLARDQALRHGLKLVADGADILDVGGESTRPGALPVSASEEIDRVLPVVERLADETDAPLSIDTTKAEVAAAALGAGACIVNDVSAGSFDPAMFDLVAQSGARMILMHMQRTPKDMQVAPSYADVVREVAAYLRERVALGLKAGIALPRIAIDPGIGFGKRRQDNLALIRALPELRSLGLPVVLGVSRKSFLGGLSGQEKPDMRIPESLAAISIGGYLGADIHRVHDVAPAVSALRVAAALGRRGTPAG